MPDLPAPYASRYSPRRQFPDRGTAKKKVWLTENTGKLLCPRASPRLPPAAFQLPFPIKKAEAASPHRQGCHSGKISIWHPLSCPAHAAYKGASPQTAAPDTRTSHRADCWLLPRFPFSSVSSPFPLSAPLSVPVHSFFRSFFRFSYFYSIMPHLSCKVNVLFCPLLIPFFQKCLNEKSTEIGKCKYIV